MIPSVVVLALAAFYLTRLVRALSPWLAARKPVGCNVCISWWASLSLAFPADVLRFGMHGREVTTALVTVATAAGACLLLLELAETLRPPPADLGMFDRP